VNELKIDLRAKTMLLRAAEASQKAPSSSCNGSGVSNSFSGLRKVKAKAVAFLQLMSEEGLKKRLSLLLLSLH
jgi:hypothetical protein